MTTQEQRVRRFLTAFGAWAARRPDILGVAVVGSYARDEAARDSDIDLVVVASDPKTYLNDTRWAQDFGIISRERIEHYGRLTSLRVWYLGSHEVEYGFTDETWSEEPLDEGTQKVISGGLRILSERGSILSRLKRPKSILGNSK